MATVYLAHDDKHDRAVAIKVLRPDLSAALGGDRFLREIQIAAKLQHPHVVPLYDSGSAAGLLYYVMPFVEGESLRQRLDREGALPVTDALGIAADVAEALSYAHSHGIVHRDVKPENIMLTAGHAVVADFGIARAIDAAGAGGETSSGLAIGTPAYMSPEQGSASGFVDARSDVYSLGCVLHEMLAGAPPFSGPTPQSVIARHLTEPPPSVRALRPTISDAVALVVGTALAKAAADRFTTALRFQEALAWARHDSSPARPPPRRLGHAVAGALLAGGVGLALVALLIGPGETTTTGPPLSRIAVLPLEDRSQAGELSTVADGLTGDLIAELSRVEPLWVASENAVRQFEGVPYDSLAQALDVGTVVGGVVEGTASKPRVRIEMVSATTGDVLLSRMFEEPIEDLFALRKSIVDEMVWTLRRTLGEVVRQKRLREDAPSLGAWLLVADAGELKEAGTRLAIAGDGSGAFQFLLDADSLAERAASLDPDWVAPLLLRGWLARSLAVVAAAEDSTDPRYWIDQGFRHVERALSLVPDLPAAFELRGALRYSAWSLGSGTSGADSLLAAERDLRAALRAEPSRAVAWQHLSAVLLDRGELQQADLAARKAFEKDAYVEAAETAIPTLLFATLHAGEFARAGEWCDMGRKRFPRNPNFVECPLEILGWTGDRRDQADQAWTLIGEIEARTSEDPDPVWPYRRMHLAAILARIGMRDSAEAIIRRLRERHPAGELRLQEAYVRLLLGDTAVAEQLLAEEVSETPEVGVFIRTHYWFRDLRGRPRFDAAVAQR
jgi:serine/threonine-protein kinase